MLGTLRINLFYFFEENLPRVVWTHLLSSHCVMYDVDCLSSPAVNCPVPSRVWIHFQHVILGAFTAVNSVFLLCRFLWDIFIFFLTISFQFHFHCSHFLFLCDGFVLCWLHTLFWWCTFVKCPVSLFPWDKGAMQLPVGWLSAYELNDGCAGTSCRQLWKWHDWLVIMICICYSRRNFWTKKLAVKFALYVIQR